MPIGPFDVGTVRRSAIGYAVLSLAETPQAERRDRWAAAMSSAGHGSSDVMRLVDHVVMR